eukprot:CAMPEP_0184644390 /NCGR_PEP_ID=MMETSP0308-20130426/1114_1 /TAXON_ID=38269 /ORGANISM="Gloeochaete witrockiana, Strain SAG 46.84" /LENGTH=36 /DNA_ID= /DNA_START= /DNA_END= /DNA_ORIENTATION=
MCARDICKDCTEPNFATGAVDTLRLDTGLSAIPKES